MRIGQKLIIPLFCLMLANIITGIMRGDVFFYYVKFALPFLVFIIFLYFLKKEIHFKIISIALLAGALISHWMGHITELTGISLFLFSISISKKSNIVYYICFAFFILISLYKFNVNNMASSQFFAFLSGPSTIIIIYFHYIYQKKEVEKIFKKNYSLTDINKDVVDILTLRIQGVDWPEINDILELNVTDERVRRKVTEESKKHGFTNREEFIFWATEKGVIKSVSVNSNKSKNKYDIL